MWDFLRAERARGAAAATGAIVLVVMAVVVVIAVMGILRDLAHTTHPRPDHWPGTGWMRPAEPVFSMRRPGLTAQ
jgi:hypothetical protein